MNAIKIQKYWKRSLTLQVYYSVHWKQGYIFTTGWNSSKKHFSLTKNDDYAVKEDAKDAVWLIQDVVFTKQLSNDTKSSAIPVEFSKSLRAYYMQSSSQRFLFTSTKTSVQTRAEHDK